MYCPKTPSVENVLLWGESSCSCLSVVINHQQVLMTACALEVNAVPLDLYEWARSTGNTAAI